MFVPPYLFPWNEFFLLILSLHPYVREGLINYSTFLDLAISKICFSVLSIEKLRSASQVVDGNILLVQNGDSGKIIL